ncbi:MAG: hypothetical protein LBS97_03520 [Treponema sp.]|jgi:hypothetical protein|nr:hypothetical protein [Treponema sp.]
MEQAGRERRKNWHNKKNWNRPKTSPQENARKSEKQAAALAERAKRTREVADKLQHKQNEVREALKVFRQTKHLCPRCNNVIQELSNALPDRVTGEPVHFDCVLAMLNEQERGAPSEKIAYIGQGRFGVLYFENPNDTKHFTIRRIIEWDVQNLSASWRSGIPDLFSQV